PIFRLRGGRGLPFPPGWSHLDGFLQRAGRLQQLSWPIPAPSTSQQLFFFFFLLLGAVAFVLWQGIVAIRRAPDSIQSRTLLVVGLFGPGMMSQAVQGGDSPPPPW